MSKKHLLLAISIMLSGCYNPHPLKCPIYALHEGMNQVDVVRQCGAPMIIRSSHRTDTQFVYDGFVYLYFNRQTNTLVDWQWTTQ